MIVGHVYLIADSNGNIWSTKTSLNMAREVIEILAKTHSSIEFTINKVERTKVVK